VRLLLNNLQRYKTILILNDSNTPLLSNNGSCLEFRFICVVWLTFETKALYALRKGKNWVTSEAENGSWYV